MQVPVPLQKALAALNGVTVPGSSLFKIANEHLIQAHGVCTVLIHDLVRVDYIAAGLAHFLAVLTQDHTVGGTLLVRLLGRHHANVIQELVPEAGVQQMQGGVLHTAVVPVHRRPVIQGFRRCQSVRIVGIHIAQEVPAGAGPLRHGIRLSLSRTATAGAGGVHPVGHFGQGAFAGVRRLIAVYHRQAQRQLALRQRHIAALVALDDGDRLAPVTLAAEHPVTQLEVHFLMALALCGQPFNDLLLSFFHA